MVQRGAARGTESVTNPMTLAEFKEWFDRHFRKSDEEIAAMSYAELFALEADCETIVEAFRNEKIRRIAAGTWKRRPQ